MGITVSQNQWRRAMTATKRPWSNMDVVIDWKIGFDYLQTGANSSARITMAHAPPSKNIIKANQNIKSHILMVRWYIPSCNTLRKYEFMMILLSWLIFTSCCSSIHSPPYVRYRGVNVSWLWTRYSVLLAHRIALIGLITAANIGHR